MFSLVYLNNTAWNKLTFCRGKVAVISALVTLIASFLIYQFMGGANSFLPHKPIGGYILMGVATLSLIDTLRFLQLYLDQKKTTDLINLKKPLKIDESDVNHFRQYQYDNQKNLKTFYAEHVSFFYSNCDKQQDNGGRETLWRCIQTCGSPYGFFETVQQLSERYASSTFERLEIAQKYFSDNKTNCETFYHRKDDFQSLKDKLVNQFEHKNYRNPVMVNDGMYLFMILGIKITESEHVILWIADPNKTSKEAGLYYLTLDKEGHKLECTGADESAEAINPQKNWMVLFPKENQIN